MERRQPGFVTNRAQDYGLAQNEEARFITHLRANRYEVTGKIVDVCHTDRHYSRSYRLFRALAFGEPFQLRKNGRNQYGTSASYTILRLMPQVGNELIDVLCCGECGVFSAGDEVTLRLSKPRIGEYILISGFNHSKNNYIRRDPLTISPTTLRASALVIILLLTLAIVWLANGGIDQLVYGVLSVIGWLLTALWRAFGVVIILVIGVAIVVKSLFRK